MNNLCRSASVRCVNIDLPGPLAPSVVSDNRGGAMALTKVVIEKLKERGADTGDIYFSGALSPTTRRTVGCSVSAMRSPRTGLCKSPT